MSEPIVSVIIPTYNRADMVTKAIDSVLAQDFKGFEVIVSDDGSTDNTPDVLSDYGEKITIVRGPNCGTGAAINRAVSAARGEFFALLGSDDLMLPGRLTAQVNFMRAHPEIAAVSGNFTFQGQEEFNYLKSRGIDFNGQQWVILEKPFQKLIHKNFMTDAASMTRIKYYIEVQGLDSSLRRSSELDFWLKIARQWPLACMNMPCTLVGKHEGNRNIINSPIHTTSVIRVLDKALSYGEPIDATILKSVHKRLWHLLRMYLHAHIEMPIEKNWRLNVKRYARYLPWYQQNYLKLMTILPQALLLPLLQKKATIQRILYQRHIS